ncbi:hypothetical protein JHK82_042586 [Glycine max]|nr:hypothetical protein JHK85_043247 [Glycine max]KAG5105616.1 hypothetical protein JHK82_042586 [Glycine max]
MRLFLRKGDLVTCSMKNSEIYYAVLGGLGQFGVITRARIPLGPAPTRATDYVEGVLLLNQPPLDLSFYASSDQQRITSLDLANLVKGLNFVPTFMFEKDASYEEFLNRIHADELVLRSKGLWEVPHPWLNIWVPRSRISDFNDGVFKDIILKQNITAGISLVYPMNRNK